MIDLIVFILGVALGINCGYIMVEKSFLYGLICWLFGMTFLTTFSMLVKGVLL